MTKKRYNTYCDQNENRTVIDDDLNNTHIFIAYCGDLNEAIRLKTAFNSVTDELNALHEENTRLKIRNNRQCQTLDKLYKLIEKQDWETLTGIIQELKEADERLQKEWSEYL